jgi:hypothetical protein
MFRTFIVRRLTEIFCEKRKELWVENDLAAVTITGDRAANLDLCLAFTAFSSEMLSMYGF